MNATFNLKRFFLLEQYNRKPADTCFGVPALCWAFVFSA
jgi:hypothetical protein